MLYLGTTSGVGLNLMNSLRRRMDRIIYRAVFPSATEEAPWVMSRAQFDEIVEVYPQYFWDREKLLSLWRWKCSKMPGV